MNEKLFINDTEPTSISRWGDKNELLLSQYGDTTYQKWCEFETKRIPGTTIGIWRDKIAVVKNGVL